MARLREDVRANPRSAEHVIRIARRTFDWFGHAHIDELRAIVRHEAEEDAMAVFLRRVADAPETTYEIIEMATRLNPWFTAARARQLRDHRDAVMRAREFARQEAGREAAERVNAEMNVLRTRVRSATESIEDVIRDARELHREWFAAEHERQLRELAENTRPDVVRERYRAALETRDYMENAARYYREGRRPPASWTNEMRAE